MSGRSNSLAKQVGEHLVCAELGRRGFLATPFAGNVPTFDVLAADEQCRTVPIQVKATRGDNWLTDIRLWMHLDYDPQTGVQRYVGPVALASPELIYVCVVIAAPGERDRFFVLTQADLQGILIAAYSGWMEGHGWKRPRKSDSFHCISRTPCFDVMSWRNQIQRLTKSLYSLSYISAWISGIKLSRGTT